ncbi:MAG TPA: zf-HC2 domain-containing protein [bacterium]|nr:zf-HC2 domain-containing protein [bacterium]
MPVCKEELIDLYLDGELDPGARGEVEEHLRGCARCRDLLAARKRQADAYRGLIAAAVEAAEEDADSVWDAVAEAICRPRRIRIIRLRVAAWAGAAAAAAAAAVLLLHPGAGTPPASSSKILSLNSPGHDITIYQPQTGFTVVWLQEQS